MIWMTMLLGILIKRYWSSLGRLVELLFKMSLRRKPMKPPFKISLDMLQSLELTLKKSKTTTSTRSNSVQELQELESTQTPNEVTGGFPKKWKRAQTKKSRNGFRLLMSAMVMKKKRCRSHKSKLETLKCIRRIISSRWNLTTKKSERMLLFQTCLQVWLLWTNSILWIQTSKINL